MFVLTFSLTFAVFIVALAIFTNQRRARDVWDFELKPNCLLTRWPILFVTGRRSVFYFSKYWNHYPSFLAEHGYEVFTLHLPWNKKALRKARMQEFFQKRSEEGRRFHLVVDSQTLEEVRELLAADVYSCVMSLTEICDAEQGQHIKGGGLKVPWSPVEMTSKAGGGIVRAVFWGHRLLHHETPTLATLGASPSSRHDNALLLLERAQTLAETDLGTP